MSAPHAELTGSEFIGSESVEASLARPDARGTVRVIGGPGTGKTVVALHRVAYLLYTKRARLESHGVLVVGPNADFLDHIGRVLPSPLRGAAG